MADPLKQWWTMADIADHWRVKLGTIWDYRHQTRHPKPGQAPKLPPEDEMIGRTPVWHPQTIIGFQRPGRGHGGGRPRRRPGHQRRQDTAACYRRQRPVLSEGQERPAQPVPWKGPR